MSALLAVAVLPALLAISVQDPVINVSEFDHGELAASYVLSTPARAAGERGWPLVLDFHGAIAPGRQGAVVTRDRLWAPFVADHPWLVAGINGRTRAWNTVKGERDDRAHALRVLAEVRAGHPVDVARMYLAGFSSGSDFLCSGGLQLGGPFAGSLVVCPGPA